jgi:hypothetical protein
MPRYLRHDLIDTILQVLIDILVDPLGIVQTRVPVFGVGLLKVRSPTPSSRSLLEWGASEQLIPTLLWVFG